MGLGISIKKIRKNRGFSQETFSRVVNITQSYLSQVESGQKEPSMALVKKISKNLNVPIPILFWFTLTEKDVPKNKIGIYNELKTSVDSLVYAFFS